MIKPAVGIDRFRRKMGCDTFHNHIAAEDDIIQTHRHMTGTMPRQMDHFKRTNMHIHGFVSKVYGHRSVEGFGGTINVEKLITRLFSEARFSQERSEATTDEGKSGFVMRDRLEIQFVTAKLRIGQWL